MEADFEPTGKYLRRLQNNNPPDHLSYAALLALHIFKCERYIWEQAYLFPTYFNLNYLLLFLNHLRQDTGNAS